VGARAAGTHGAPGAVLHQEADAGAQATRGAPGTTLSREVGAGATGTRGAPRAALHWEAGTGATGTRGTPGAALLWEVGARAAGTHGTPRATLSQEVGARAAGTCGSLRAVLSQEVGVRVVGTCGTPGAALTQEVGAGAVGTHGAPVAALRREVGAGAQATHGAPRASLSREAGTTPPPPLPRPSVGGQGVVVPVTPPDNPHRIITRGKTGFRVVPDRLVLTAVTSSPTPSLIPSSARAALADPHWCAAMEEEYDTLIRMGPGSWFPDLRAPTLSLASGSSHTSSMLTGPLIATRPVKSFRVSLSTTESTTTRLSARL
jgi:hypothetical protein